MQPLKPANIQKFSTRIREETREAHTLTENVEFIKGFLKGTIDYNSYAQLMTSLYFVYDEMEKALQETNELPFIKPIYFIELIRKPTLEEDLKFFIGEDWENKISPSPATRAYTEHIRRIKSGHAESLIAHSYVRYLGDLSGGQILKKIARRALNLPEGQGTAFYEFEAIPDAKEFKKTYKIELDNLPISDQTREEIIREAIHVFHLNMALFKELSGSPLKALAKTLNPFNHR